MFYLYSHSYQGSPTDLSFLKHLELSNKTIRVSLYPKDMKISILNYLVDSGAILNPNLKSFTHFLSLVYSQSTFYYAVLPKEFWFEKDNSILRQPELISRALYKIKESIERFTIDIQKDWKIMDIGASPGAITWYLSTHIVTGGLVAAVDPSDLTVNKQLPDNVKFFKGKAENVYDQLQPLGSFDAMVVDINERAWVVMDIMKVLTPLIRVGGYMIWTIKLPSMNGDGQPVIVYLDRVLKTFAKEFPDFGNCQVKWLLSNRNERALVAIKTK